MIYTATSVQPGGLKKPIPEAVKADEEEAKYLIMFDLPPDHANIVETYIKNKENLAIACGDHPVKEEVEQKAKKGKGKKKGKAGKCHQPCFHRQSVNMISSIVESGSTSSQIPKSTKPSSDDTLASVIQRLDTLQTSNEQLMELNNKLLEKSAGWGSSITNLNSTADKLKVSDAKLEASNNKLMEKSAGWGSSITNLNSTVDKLKASDAKLEASNTKLEEASNTKLEAASNAKLEAASNAKLEKELAKERDDRKAERDSLEERLEKQDRSFMAKLAEEREARKRDIQSISEVRALPKHCSHYRPSFFGLAHHNFDTSPSPRPSRPYAPENPGHHADHLLGGHRQQPDPRPDDLHDRARIGTSQSSTSQSPGARRHLLSLFVQQCPQRWQLPCAQC